MLSITLASAKPAASPTCCTLAASNSYGTASSPPLVTSVSSPTILSPSSSPWVLASIVRCTRFPANALGSTLILGLSVKQIPLIEILLLLASSRVKPLLLSRYMGSQKSSGIILIAGASISVIPFESLVILSFIRLCSVKVHIAKCLRVLAYKHAVRIAVRQHF